MWDNLIGRQIRRCNRNLLITNVLLLAGVAAYVASDYRYVANFVLGSKEISASEIAQLQNPIQRFRFFVSVRGDRSFDTGLQSVEQKIDENTQQVQSTTVKADYRVLLVGTKLLVVKADPSATGTFFKGALEPIPDSVNEQVIGATVRDNPALQGMFVPALLNANDYREQGWWAIAICLPVLMLSLWNLWKWKTRVSDYSAHPIYRRLSSFGRPEDLAEQIEAQVRMNPSEKIGTGSLCGDWLFSPAPFSLEVFHVPDLVWVYQKVTRQSVNFIPAGKSFSICLSDRSGRSSEIRAAKKRVESLVPAILQKCPWAVAGFSEELKKAWESQRTAFIAAVDERRAQLSAATTSARG